MGAVLAIATHPDDETLGCGGTLLNHKDRGENLYWLIVTSAWEPDYSSGAVQQQGQQVQAVKTAYPFTGTEWLRLPTIRLETVPMNELITRLREVIRQVGIWSIRTSIRL